MFVNTNKQLRGVKNLIIIATILVSCVKNDVENGIRTLNTQLPAEKNILTGDQLQKPKPLTLSHTSTPPASEISKNFSLRLDKVSQLRMSLVQLENKSCSQTGSFKQDISLIDPNNKQTRIHPNQKPHTVQPGFYRLVIKGMNNGACEKIHAEYTLQVSPLQDETVSKNIDLGLVCTIEPNKSLLIHTDSLASYLITNHDSTATITTQPLFDHQHMCGVNMAKLECHPKLLKVKKNQHELFAKTSRCRSLSPNQPEGNVNFKLTQNNTVKAGSWTCHDRRQLVYNHSLTNCTPSYNFGSIVTDLSTSSLVVDATNQQATIEWDSEKLKMDSIDFPIYLTIMGFDHDEYDFKNRLEKYLPVSALDFEGGTLVITGSSYNKIQHQLSVENRLHDLKVVFLTDKNPLSGIYSITLGDFCSQYKDRIATATGQSLCE